MCAFVLFILVHLECHVFASMLDFVWYNDNMYIKNLTYWYCWF